MIQMQSLGYTGRTCPHCSNQSVFSTDVESFWGVYRYTQLKCEMPCGFIKLYDKNIAYKEDQQDDGTKWDTERLM